MNVGEVRVGIDHHHTATNRRQVDAEVCGEKALSDAGKTVAQIDEVILRRFRRRCEPSLAGSYAGSRKSSRSSSSRSASSGSSVSVIRAHAYQEGGLAATRGPY